MRSLSVNLLTSFPSMIFGWALTCIIFFFGYDTVPRLTLFLMISLVLQDLFARCSFTFSNEIQIYSEELANKRIPLYLQSKIGSSLTVICIVLSKYIIALFILLLATGMFRSQMFTINSETILCLVIIMGLLLDPILALILRINDDSPFMGEAITALAGYLALLLIGVGAISSYDIGKYEMYSILLTFSILTTRMAFMSTFAFDKREGILVFAPCIFALCAVVLPNLHLLLRELI